MAHLEADSNAVRDGSQMHYHTFSCYKFSRTGTNGQKICRFFYPKYPHLFSTHPKPSLKFSSIETESVDKRLYRIHLEDIEANDEQAFAVLEHDVVYGEDGYRRRYDLNYSVPENAITIFEREAKVHPGLLLPQQVLIPPVAGLHAMSGVYDLPAVDGFIDVSVPRPAVTIDPSVIALESEIRDFVGGLLPNKPDNVADPLITYGVCQIQCKFYS